jgi:hypothetical protein
MASDIAVRDCRLSGGIVLQKVFEFWSDENFDSRILAEIQRRPRRMIARTHLRPALTLQ